MRNFKQRKWTTFLLVFFLGASFFVPLVARANTGDFNDRAEEKFEQKLREYIQTRGLEMLVDDVQIAAPARTIAEYDGNAEAYASDIFQAYQEDGVKASSNSADVTSGFLPLGAANYTSAVFAGVPAVGICWIHQDFRATVNNYKVVSKSFLGSSYQTGGCVFHWSPNYSYFSGNLNVNSKGVFSAVIKGGPVKFSATFMAIYKVNKTSLKQKTQ